MREGFQSGRAVAALATAVLVGIWVGPSLARQTPPLSAPQGFPPNSAPRNPSAPPALSDHRPPDVALPRRPPVITNPRWLQSPRPEYPAIAMANGVYEGRATLQCMVTIRGRLADCVVVDESPREQGFGAAAVAAAASAQIEPRTVDGNATPGTMRFTTRYQSPEPAPVPPQPPARR
ncbi:TonB family protein [Brevundimonas sp.]|uniref:TonB family protein n=1 Tax=Brevundimonas sp. TaxID=1871086 RepID=UPI00345012EB